MKNSKYSGTDLGQKEFEEYCLQLHQRRIKNIKTKMTLNNSTEGVVDMANRINYNKYRAHEFTNKERAFQIRSSNKVLLERLRDISKGKWLSVVTAVGRDPRKRLQNKTIATNRGSMNCLIRRQELDRIEKENLKMAQRLIQKESALPKKEFDDFTHQQTAYKKHLSKSKWNKGKVKERQGSNIKLRYILPPLVDEQPINQYKSTVLKKKSSPHHKQPNSQRNEMKSMPVKGSTNKEVEDLGETEKVEDDGKDEHTDKGKENDTKSDVGHNNKREEDRTPLDEEREIKLEKKPKEEDPIKVEEEGNTIKKEETIKGRENQPLNSTPHDNKNSEIDEEIRDEMETPQN